MSIGSDGKAEAVAPGETTIWASLDGVRGSATVTVEAGPRIAVAPSSIGFFAGVGAEPPDPEAIEITNVGGGTLGGLSARVEYPVGGAVGWLSLSLTGTTAPSTLTVSVPSVSLAAGSYSATVLIESSTALNSPVSVPVQLVMTQDQPVIHLEPTTMTFQVETGGSAPAPQSLQITNVGGGTLSNLTATVFYQEIAGWLSLTLSSPSAPSEIQVQPDPTGLAVGTYHAEIRVLSPTALNSPRSVDVTLTVAPPQSANLAVTKSGTTVASVDDTVVFVLSVANAGPGEARNVVLVDSLPEGLTWARASGGATQTNGVVTWNLGNVPNGATVVDSLWAVAAAEGTLTNVGRVSSSIPDPDSGDNRATSSVTVSGHSANLQVTKTGPATATFGETIQYELTVLNGGPYPAETVVLVDSLPDGVDFVSATGEGTAEGRQVTWDGGTLAAGESFVATLTATVNAAGALTNVARASSSLPDPNLENNRATFTTSVGATADVSMSKSGPAIVQIFDTIAYVLAVSNAGPDPAANITVFDSLPNGLTFLSAPGGRVLEGGIVAWDVETIEPNKTVTLNVRLLADQFGSFLNVGKVASGTPDPSTEDLRAAVTTVVEAADVSVTKTAPFSADAGAQITYDLTVQNAGPDPAVNTVVTDTLPESVAFVSATGGGVYDAGALPNGTITWNLGNLTAAAGPQNFQVVVNVDPGASGGLANVAVVSSETGDQAPENNRQVASTFLQSSADLVMVKSGPGTAAPGTEVTDLLTVSNVGPSNAAGVVVTDTLPAGVTFVSASASGAYDPVPGPNGVVTWATIPNLPVGADTVLSVVFAVPSNATGTVENIGAVTAFADDPNGGNNRSAFVTTLAPSADLVVGKDGDATAAAGGTATYSITVTNNGPSDASSLVVRDVLPQDVTFSSASDGGSESGGVVTWNLAGLASGADKTYTLTVTVGGSLAPRTDSAYVSAATADPSAANDTATFVTTVNPGPPSAGTSTATVPDGTAGAATNIVVQAKDAFGNNLTTGGATVRVTVTGANSAGPLTATYAGGGTYSTSYTPTVAGLDQVAITLNGSAISGSPYSSTVTVGALSPANSTADVPDGTAGSTTNIVVQARDAYGNLIGTGGATVVVNVSGANTAGPLTAIDHLDGTYTTSYTPTAAGTDNVAITMNGIALNASPYTSTIGAGNASPASSTATVPDGTAGEPTDIVVQARDANGNPLTTGGEAVRITVAGANTAGPIVAADQNNGTYRASYTPTAAGNDEVTITMNGTQISGSPFTSTVGPAALDAANSTATVPAGTAGSATTIVVQARDAYGNPLTTGGATVRVTVSGANSAGPLTAAYSGSGTYTTSYTPTAAGTDNVAITINTIALDASPYSSVVSPGPVSAAHSTATVPAGTAGSTTDIVVQARDANDNPLTTGGATVLVSVSGANTAGPLTAAYAGSGTYTTSYTPTASGTDQVAITLNGTAISGSPYPSPVSPGAPAKYLVTSSGYSPGGGEQRDHLGPTRRRQQQPGHHQRGRGQLQ